MTLVIMGLVGLTLPWIRPVEINGPNVQLTLIAYVRPSRGLTLTGVAPPHGLSAGSPRAGVAFVILRVLDAIYILTFSTGSGLISPLTT